MGPGRDERTLGIPRGGTVTPDRRDFVQRRPEDVRGDWSNGTCPSKTGSTDDPGFRRDFVADDPPRVWEGPRTEPSSAGRNLPSTTNGFRNVHFYGDTRNLVGGSGCLLKSRSW